MGTLSYPFTLTAGQPENVNQLNSNLAAIGTLVNGNLDAANLATSAKPATLLAPYNTVSTVSSLVGAVSTGVYVLSAYTLLPSGAAVATAAQHLVPVLAADYAVSGLTTKLRMRAAMATNATAPGITWTFGLYTISLVGGAPGTISVTVGAVVSGSTVALAPGASTLVAGVGTDISLPADGVYVLGVAASGATPANSVAIMNARLEVRHV